ncbi:hypothetical protein DO97_14360 [Neosynechococcus sphagnicola sy1]|uniref:Uncharacterized protein n=2 Tax=Neosynechococcus TaxID=1501143 RepID=A0A098TIX1_9CYAN|nr:hypothetical protein DO97_14360 [Neosynechococcus sphagnicola sy1]
MATLGDPGSAPRPPPDQRQPKEDLLTYWQRILALRGVKIDDNWIDPTTILLLTWVDRRNFDPDGHYIDPHLGDLAPMLRDRGLRVVYVPRILHTIPYPEAIDRLLQSGETFLFLELLLTEVDWQTCQQQAQAFQPCLNPEDAIAGVPTYRLTQEHLEQTRNTLAFTLTYGACIASLATRNMQPRQIIHTCEGHSWEQALAWSVRHYLPHTAIVGYDNGNFSRLALCLYPAAHELGLRPLPDRIVAGGSLFQHLLIAEGFPKEKVVRGCALRHAYLWADPAAVKAHPPCRLRILVATSIGLGDSVELVSKAVQAFGADPNVTVMIKCHPLVDWGQVARYARIPASQTQIQVVNTPISQLLPTVDILLYTYTLVCYEALQYGVKPIFVRSENFLNLNPLEAAPDIHWVATTPTDLQARVQQISQMPPPATQAWQDRATEVLEAALHPVSPACLDAFLIGRDGVKQQ